MKKYILLLLLLCTPFLSCFAEVLQEITVKEGDTLWSVANFYLKDPKRWPEILNHNSLPSSDPNIILPGMKLRVPVLLIKEQLRAAHLVFVQNDVRYRRQKEAEWKDARLNMELFNEDGLRTMQQSAAQVKFPSGELLKLDENSLVILRPDKKVEEIDLLSGGVRSSKTKILASDTIVDPRIEPRGANPDFKTRVKEDKTTLVEVFDGIIDVTAQGRTVTLTKGFGTQVKFKQPPSLPHPLPPQPDFSMAKSAGAQTESSAISAKSIPVNVFKPAEKINTQSTASRTKIVQKTISRYHIQISTSNTFASLIIDRINDMSEKINITFAQYGLNDGTYFYRIAFVDELGFEGQYTQGVQFTVDTSAPLLEILPQKESGKKDKFIYIEGITEPRAVVKINEYPVTVDESGKFIGAIIPKKDEYRFMVTAQDAAGNASQKEVVFDKERALQSAEIQKEEDIASGKKVSKIASFSIASLTLVVILGVLLFIAK